MSTTVMLNQSKVGPCGQTVCYTQVHVLYRNKTRKVNLRAVFLWRISGQCSISHSILLNHLDSPDSTEPYNSHLPVPDLTFFSPPQLAKSFYETYNMLCPGNGLVFPVGSKWCRLHPGCHVPVQMVKIFFLSQQMPRGTLELGLGPRVIAKQFLFHPF